jgi:dTDP-4-amino-4,6-dideoxygalactose transaminase
MKTNLSDLAIFGAAPALPEKTYVGRPNIGDPGRLLERIKTLLASRWLTNSGPLVKEFEQRVADFLGVKHCIAMCNATIGLEIAIKATGLTGEVIVPSFTFIATAHALQWQGISPVFCDVDPLTHNLDPTRLEQLITPKTTGILAVHLWGRPCNIEALTDIARHHRLVLLFDAAHAFACSHAGHFLGGGGDAEVFSFHATKFFNTFEGGAITTNDDALAEKARLMRNFGFTGYDEVVYVGTNGKMSEISAAMGLTSLEGMDDFISANRSNYQLYCAELAELSGLTVIEYNQAERNNYQYIVLEINQAETGISRDELMNVLWAENIIARRYFHPGCHRMEPYRTLDPKAGLTLPVTEELAARVLLLPNGTAVGENEILEICRVIRLVMERPAEVRAQLAHVPPAQPAKEVVAAAGVAEEH